MLSDCGEAQCTPTIVLGKQSVSITLLGLECAASNLFNRDWCLYISQCSLLILQICSDQIRADIFGSLAQAVEETLNTISANFYLTDTIKDLSSWGEKASLFWVGF